MDEMAVKFKYIEEFERLGFGLFIHFGLYSVEGKGEWYQSTHNVPQEKYLQLVDRFKVKKTWAKELVQQAKKTGCKYITITTRHHDGFSLYDTCGLNEFDAPHSPTGRDLIREFVDECRKEWNILISDVKKRLYEELYIKHEIHFRLYRNWEDFEEYNLQSIKKIKEEISNV